MLSGSFSFRWKYMNSDASGTYSKQKYTHHITSLRKHGTRNTEYNKESSPAKIELLAADLCASTWTGSCCLNTGARSGRMSRTYSSLVHSSAISSTLGSTKGTMSGFTNSEVRPGRIRCTTTLCERGEEREMLWKAKLDVFMCIRSGLTSANTKSGFWCCFIPWVVWGEL